MSKFHFVLFYIFKTIEGRSFKLISKASSYILQSGAVFPKLTYFAGTFKSSLQWVPVATSDTRMQFFTGLSRSEPQSDLKKKFSSSFSIHTTFWFWAKN